MVEVTIGGAVLGTALVLPYWLFVVRPIVRRVESGHQYPPLAFGLRLGGGGTTERSMRSGAVIVLLFVVGTSAPVPRYGYMPYFGLVAYWAAWMSVIYWVDSGLWKERFRRAGRIVAVGCLPWCVATGLAWFGYLGAIRFPLWSFYGLNAASAAVLLYAVASRMPDGQRARHPGRHHRNNRR